MRKALNEDPKVQMIVLAVCAIAFAVILFTQVLSKGGGSDATDSATTTAPAIEGTASAPPVTDSAAPATSATATPPASSSATATPSAPPTTAPPSGGSVGDGLLPSKGLPQDVLVAFAKNKTIALLVVDPKAFADKRVKTTTETLRRRGDVEVFVVNVKDIAKYARITAGVNVSRTPALVVIRPRKLTGSVPTATVSYGFRGAQSVNQAIDDALYKGKQVPAYP
ncbi:MAG: hypothetical protein KDB46_12310 [Solirubrobacterales bacterium]|nr:hypothetical protein [Solirubrobacterales bacterium]